MDRAQRVRISELNPHLMCVLCGGYYVDATTIIECLHSFCKTCIVRYLESSKYCPICDVQVHKTKPLLNIRPDRTLQELVYKLVPGLYTREVIKRREFYRQNASSMPDLSSDDETSFSDSSSVLSEPAVGGSAVGTDTMSISLELSMDGKPVTRLKGKKSIHHSEKILQRRYLMCPATFTIGHLKKFIRMKLDISTQLEVDVFHIDEPLSDSYALMDIAYIYSWFKTVPLPLYFSVFDRPVKVIKRLKVDNLVKLEPLNNTALPSEVRKSDLCQSLQSDAVHKVSEDPDTNTNKPSSKITAKRKSQTKEESSVSREKIPKCSNKESTSKSGKSTNKSPDKTIAKQKLSSSNDGQSSFHQQVIDAVDSELLAITEDPISISAKSHKVKQTVKSPGKQTGPSAHKTQNKKMDKKCDASYLTGNGYTNDVKSTQKCSPSKQIDASGSKTASPEVAIGQSTKEADKEQTVQELSSKQKHRQAKENGNQSPSANKDKLATNGNPKCDSKSKDKKFVDNTKDKDTTKEHAKETSVSHGCHPKSTKDPMFSKTKDTKSIIKPKESKSSPNSKSKDDDKGQKLTKSSHEPKSQNDVKSRDTDSVQVSKSPNSRGVNDAKETESNVKAALGISSNDRKDKLKLRDSRDTKSHHSKNTKRSVGDDLQKDSKSPSNDSSIQMDDSKSNGQSTNSTILTPMPKDQMDDTKSNGCKISTSSSGKSIVVSIPKHLLEKSSSDKEKKKKKRDNHHHHKHHKKHRRQSREERVPLDTPGKSGIESAEESVRSGSTPSVSSSPSSDRGSPDESNSKPAIPVETPSKTPEADESINTLATEEKRLTNKTTQQREPVLQQLQYEMEKQKEKTDDTVDTHDPELTTPTAAVKEKAMEAIAKIKRDPQSSPVMNTAFSQLIRKKSGQDGSHMSKGKEPNIISTDAKTMIKMSNTGIPKTTSLSTEGTNGNTKKSILSRITSPSRLMKPKQACKPPVTCATVTNLQQGKVYGKFGQTNNPDKHKPSPSKMPMTVDLTRTERPDAPKVSMPWMSLSTLAEAGRKIQESANTALGRTSPAKPPPTRNWIDDRQKSNGIQIARSSDTSDTSPVKSAPTFTEPYSAFGSPTLPKGIKTYSKKDKFTYKHQNVFNQSPPSHNYEGAFKNFLGCPDDAGSPPKKPKYSLSLSSPHPSPDTGSSTSNKYLASPKKDRTPTSPQTGMPRHLHGHKVIGQLQMVYETIQKPTYPEVCRKSPKPTSPQKSPLNILDKDELAKSSQPKIENQVKLDTPHRPESSPIDDNITAGSHSPDKLLSEQSPSDTNAMDSDVTQNKATNIKPEPSIPDQEKQATIAIHTTDKSSDNHTSNILEPSQSIVEESDKPSQTQLTEKACENVTSDDTPPKDCDKKLEKTCAPPNPCESSFSAAHLTTVSSPPRGGHNICGAASPPDTLSSKCIPSPAPESPKHSATSSGSSTQISSRVVTPPREESRDQSRSTCHTTCPGHTSGYPVVSGSGSPQNNNLSAASSVDIGVHCDQCHSASTPTGSDANMFEKIAPQEVPLNLHKPRTQSQPNPCPVQTDGSG